MFGDSVVPPQFAVQRVAAEELERVRTIGCQTAFGELALSV
jgi:hypothetical protein